MYFYYKKTYYGFITSTIFGLLLISSNSVKSQVAPPFTDSIQSLLNATNPVDITLSDFTGRIQKTLNMEDQTTSSSLDLTGVSKGVCFISNGKSQKQKKIEIEQMKIAGELKIIIGSGLFAVIPVCVILGNASSVYFLLFGRLLLASTLLFILEKNKRKLFSLPKKQFVFIALWSQLMLAAMLCYFLAIQYSNVSVSAALLGTQPIVIVFLAAILLKQRISSVNVIASLVTLIGVLCITQLTDIMKGDFLLGECLAIMSAFFLGLSFVLQKKYLSAFTGRQLVFYQGIFQLPLLLPFLYFTPISLSNDVLLAITLLAIVCTVIAYTLIYDGIKVVDAQKIGVLQSIEYALPIVIGILFYNEQPTLLVIVGMLLILGSCVAVSFRSNESN
jgi:drug/metabolite transporter (DMT)-like permease